MSNKGRGLCGTDLLHERNMKLHGERYKRNREADEKNVLRYMGRSARKVSSSSIITIPVVVHVVYNTEVENISDEQILSQINRLNKDFRRTNEDIVKVPDVWKNLASDTKIQFKLACKDPEGNPTRGITRIKTQRIVFEIPDDESQPEPIKFANKGGKDAWDTTRYLNIWVCNLTDRLLGYAQFPAGPPSTDGVAISHWAFGDMGSASAPNNPFGTQFNMGRTATHEIGHYLDCYHIWGDDGWLQNPCSGTDNVVDTPPQRGSNGDKPSFPDLTEKCDDTGPSGTMWMNYMDYTDDDHMYMFTVGQSVRMHAALNGSRASLLESDVLVCPIEEAELSKVMLLPSEVFDGGNKKVPVEEIL
ncbi:MAG: zinc metalloprotease [Candidatus Nitrosocosmicus sp.]|nr:zinc metalloprotease [Candidatus Nitrosocosmicus sp.]MDN5868461.1 zinc metalloprotease [Candidatus Nitrosocosmicus sp.]